MSTLIGSPDRLPTDAVTVVPIYANPDAAMLDRIGANQAGGQTRVTIQQVVGLDETPAALAIFAGGTLGKLVVTIG